MVIMNWRKGSVTKLPLVLLNTGITGVGQPWKKKDKSLNRI